MSGIMIIYWNFSQDSVMVEEVADEMILVVDETLTEVVEVVTEVTVASRIGHMVTGDEAADLMIGMVVQQTQMGETRKRAL